MGKARHTDGDPCPEEGIYGLMKAAGFTSIEQLSEDSGISVRTIFNCHYGLHAPNRSTIKLLALSLKTDPDEVQALLGEPE
jgi:lambda repressor-like predicted transcriptional regulator